MIDGESCQTYCGGNGNNCEGNSNWDGGSLYPRDGYNCYVQNVVFEEPEIKDAMEEPKIKDAMEEPEDAMEEPKIKDAMEEPEAGDAMGSGFTHLGEGECRDADGTYPLKFSKGYYDLSPHTEGNNAEEAKARCEEKCSEHAAWCVAAEVVTRDIWPSPECRLVTDWVKFHAAGQEVMNDHWGGSQMIDGESYQTYCGGNGNNCEGNSNWDGGSLYPRDGYNCYVQNAKLAKLAKHAKLAKLAKLGKLGKLAKLAKRSRIENSSIKSMGR